MNIEQARSNMVEQQIRPWGVLNQAVLDVVHHLPREMFVAPEWANLAFADVALPIGQGEFMMPPRVEARMLQALSIQPDDLCLEVGSGTGFISACMGRLGREVDSIDIHSDFIREAQQRLRTLGIKNVNFAMGNILGHWSKPQTPSYDVIALTAAAPHFLPELEQQLVIGGRLFAVVGEHYPKRAWLVTRTAPDEFERQMLFETDLAPLVGSVLPKPFEF